MDNKITALSDDELMEVSGGWLIFDPDAPCSGKKQKIVVLRKPIAAGIHPLPNVKVAAFN